MNIIRYIIRQRFLKKGWDFAYTDNGWVLIEGDWGQFLSEFSDHEGIKERFEKLIEAR